MEFIIPVFCIIVALVIVIALFAIGKSMPFSPFIELDAAESETDEPRRGRHDGQDSQTEQSDDGSFAQKIILHARADHDRWMHALYHTYP